MESTPASTPRIAIDPSSPRATENGTDLPLVLPLVLRAANLERAGFAHGFTTRAVDLGATADAPSRAASLARIGQEVGFDVAALVQVNQVHGAAALAHAAAIASAGCAEAARAAADAVVLGAESDVAYAAAVRVADCVPILVGDRRIGAVAAIHAGWRGVVSGVVASAIAALHVGGSGDDVAAIGPCIGPCCFEVDEETAARIEGAVAQTGEPSAGVVLPGARAGKAQADLRRAVRAQLAAMGVHDVEDVPGCTRCDAARFFSFRRDAAASGRHLAVVVARTHAP